MLIEKNRIHDGWQSVAGGQNVGRAPNQIEKNQAHRLRNMICRGGFGATTRPGFRDHTLDWERRDMSYDENGQFSSVNGVPEESVDNFHDQNFQDASYFVPRGTSACIMVMVGGRQYQMVPKTGRGAWMTEVALPYRNRRTISQAHMVQADKFHVTQDGESKPIIFDGSEAWRAGEGEVPVGTFMAYGMGRLCVAVKNRRQISFGDLYGSHDGTVTTVNGKTVRKKSFDDPGDSVLQFSEATYLNEGFNASIAFALGEITGMRFAPQQDSAVGDGELLAFSESGVSSFFLSQPREIWKDSAFQRVTLLGIGGRSHDMIVPFNGDLWFRADDGWRSYRQARAEIQGWAHLPLSSEIRDLMESDTSRLLQFGSAINFDNRLIATCSPRTNQGKVYHNGLTALDFDVLSTFGQATRPAWDGHWQKLKFLKLVTGKFNGINRAFAFAIDPDGKNQIYELTTHDYDDFDGPIDWDLEMRSMDFESPFNLKDILGGDVWVNDVSNEVVIQVESKTDQEPEWQPWTTIPVISKVGECGAVTCGGVPTIRKGYYPRRTISKPPASCNEQTKKLGGLAFEFQTKLSGSGHCRIDRFRLSAIQVTEDGRNSCT